MFLRTKQLCKKKLLFKSRSDSKNGINDFHLGWRRIWRENLNGFIISQFVSDPAPLSLPKFV
jgi:hypothetical protein